MTTSVRLVCLTLAGLACGYAWVGHYARGMALLYAGQYERAVREFETCVRNDPGEPEYTNRLAWVLATCPRQGIRDGGRAVSLATRACEATRWVHPYELDTLAASHAEVGKFDSAVRWQEEALSRLPDGRYRSMYRARLDLYKSHKPYREGHGALVMVLGVVGVAVGLLACGCARTG